MAAQVRSSTSDSNRYYHTFSCRSGNRLSPRIPLCSALIGKCPLRRSGSFDCLHAVAHIPYRHQSDIGCRMCSSRLARSTAPDFARFLFLTIPADAMIRLFMFNCGAGGSVPDHLNLHPAAVPESVPGGGTGSLPGAILYSHFCRLYAADIPGRMPLFPAEPFQKP